MSDLISSTREVHAPVTPDYYSYILIVNTRVRRVYDVIDELESYGNTIRSISMDPIDSQKLFLHYSYPYRV